MKYDRRKRYKYIPNSWGQLHLPWYYIIHRRSEQWQRMTKNISFCVEYILKGNVLCLRINLNVKRIVITFQQMIQSCHWVIFWKPMKHFVVETFVTDDYDWSMTIQHLIMMIIGRMIKIMIHVVQWLIKITMLYNDCSKL